MSMADEEYIEEIIKKEFGGDMRIPKYVWADLETSGLNPELDVILEVAAIITDANLEPIGEPFHSLVWNGFVSDGRMMHAKRLDEERNKIAKAMHEKNGLLDDLMIMQATNASRCTVGLVEVALINWLPALPEGVKPLTLAGSTINFDRGFFKRYMPAFLAKLSHRNRDVSDTKMAMEDALGWEFPKAEAHRSMADVRESLEHARLIQHRLRGINQRAHGSG